MPARSFSDLFENMDERPIPLIVAAKWEFSLAYVETSEKYLFSVQDWLKGLIDTKDVRTIWADIKRRGKLNEMLASIQQLPYIAADGKTYQMDFVDDKGLYLIAQHLRVTKEREVLNDIKQFLAKAGVFADRIRRDEYGKLIAEGFTTGEAQQWLDVRHKQKQQRLAIVAIWKDRGVNRPTDYADLTNQIHRVALGRTATRHKRELAVKDTPRNYISAADNATIQVTELTSGLLHIHRESYGKPELSEDIDDVRPIIDAARPEIQKVFSKKPRRLPAANRPPNLDR